MKKAVYVLTLFLCLSSCTSQNDAIIVTNAEISNAEIISTETPSEVRSNPSATPITPTPEISLSSTVEPTSDTLPIVSTATNLPISTQGPDFLTETFGLCEPIRDSLDEDLSTRSGIVIENSSTDGLDVEILTSTPNPFFVNFPSPGGSWTTNVSPNSEWLAYTVVNEYDEEGNGLSFSVSILNPSTGEQLQTSYRSTVPRIGDNGFRWLNNTLLINSTYPENNSNTFYFVILSPFTGEEETIYVSLDGYEHNLDGGTLHPTVDPMLKYIAYPCYNSILCGAANYRILEIATGEIITSIETKAVSTFPLGNIAWSPDGQYLAILGKPQSDLLNIKIFERNGEQVQDFQLHNLGTGGGDFKWSPDSSKIAFRLSQLAEEGNVEVTVAILDVKRGKISDLCLPDVKEYFWAPDSVNVVMEYGRTSESADGGKTYDLVIKNIVTGIGYKIYEANSSNYLLGWANYDPTQ